VRFIGKAKSEVEFLFDLPATQLDSAVVSIEDALYIGTAKSLSKDYTVQFLKKECVVEFPKQMIERGHRGAFMGVTEKSPSIDVLVTSSSEEIIMQKQIQVGKGLNLLLIDGIQPELDSGDEKARIAFPFTKNVYFNQTEYKLNKSSIMVLDSIIEIIKTNGKFAVSITGYTDHIGEEAKNLTLSEYRTRTVAKYLKDKGIKDSRITTNWLGSAGLVSKSEPEKNRRVVIQVTPE
uniref:OmpA family protein n=1 Tax=Dyadobacter sp. TaxID=1914288 RepID=UPI003F73005D